MSAEFEPWRCKHAVDDERLFCPPEGCSKEDGCARDRGAWPPNDLKCPYTRERQRRQQANRGPCDMIVVDDDGRWGILKAGTPLSSFDVAVETELDAEVVS